MNETEMTATELPESPEEKALWESYKAWDDLHLQAYRLLSSEVEADAVGRHDTPQWLAFLAIGKARQAACNQWYVLYKARKEASK